MGRELRKRNRKKQLLSTLPQILTAFGKGAVPVITTVEMALAEMEIVVAEIQIVVAEMAVADMEMVVEDMEIVVEEMDVEIVVEEIGDGCGD